MVETCVWYMHLHGVKFTSALWVAWPAERPFALSFALRALLVGMLVTRSIRRTDGFLCISWEAPWTLTVGALITLSV